MKTFGIVLAREFTMSPLALLLDTLRLAGDEDDRSRRVAYDWRILGNSGLPIRSSCGVDLLPTAPVGDPCSYDQIVVVGGLLGRSPQIGSRFAAFLHRAARMRVPLTALCTGSFILAELGLLDNYHCCVSWFHINEFQRRFPHVGSSANSLFVVDRDRATCCGGAGAADLAAHFVSTDLGRTAVDKATRILLFDRARSGREPQPVTGAFGARSIVVRKALSLMESNLQRPLSIAAVAKGVGSSTRQLQRLFAAEMGISPGEAYMTLRINRAATLITTSQMPLQTIAFEVGFANAGHFSRVFRTIRGCSPSGWRQAG